MSVCNDETFLQFDLVILLIVSYPFGDKLFRNFCLRCYFYFEKINRMAFGIKLIESLQQVEFARQQIQEKLSSGKQKQINIFKHTTLLLYSIYL